MLKAIHASEDIAAAREKAVRVIEKLRGLRLTRAADLLSCGRGNADLLRLPGRALATRAHQQSTRTTQSAKKSGHIHYVTTLPSRRCAAPTRSQLARFRVNEQ